MTRPSGFLQTLEYPGRLLAIGASPDGNKTVIIYAITGRSPSSQARKLVARDEGIWVQPTDEEVLKKGHVELLVYPAVLFADSGAAVSNGRQTTDIRDGLGRGANPVSILAGALGGWNYEPDAPIFTPRISGCVAGGRAGLSLVRRGPDGSTLRSYFEVPLRPGQARLISTYRGENRDPLPCFEGEPWTLGLEGRTAEDTASQVYDGLKPRTPDKDFRVAAACVFLDPSAAGGRDVRIINRHERT